MKIYLVGSKSKMEKYKEALVFLFNMNRSDIRSGTNVPTYVGGEYLVFKPSATNSFERNLKELINYFPSVPADIKILEAIQLFS